MVNEYDGFVGDISPHATNRGAPNFTQDVDYDIPDEIFDAEHEYWEKLYGENGENVPPKLVGNGIDTLEIGWYVTVRDDVLETLSTEKEQAKENNQGVVIELGSQSFILQPAGVIRYPFILDNSDVTVYISQAQVDNYPTVRVRFKSLYLWEKGCEDVVNEARELISNCLGDITQEKVSRVDLCADFGGCRIDWSDFRKFISKATDRNLYFVGGDELSGFNFGRGKVKGRVYDKTREIRRNGKTWFFSLWDSPDDETVWRVEFQLRRDFLKEYDVEDFDSFLEIVADIWRYLTNEWLCMREFDNANVSRRSFTPFWESVTSVTNHFENLFGEMTGVLRNLARKAKVDHLVRIIGGLAVSIAAIFYNREVSRCYDIGVDKSDFYRVMEWIQKEITTIDIGERIKERAVLLL